MASNWQIGDRILNRWEIHKILKGGMGIVYVVYDHQWHEAFAAKTFQDEVFARSPAIADRFTQEALTWVNLDVHENVATARFVQTIGAKPYLFLEYVSGGDLSDWIGTPRLADLPQVLRFSIQFCDGMIHAWSKGVMAHRDIKPHNCLVTQNETLKVTDFGLAKVFDDIGAVDSEIPNSQGLSVVLTRTGTAAGTCTHMAPEQFDDVKNVDVRADIYSFGVMLYQMLTGRLPFEGRTCMEFERFHRSQHVPSLDQRSAELSTILQRCLAKDPANRYREFGETRGELARIYEGLTGEEVPDPVTGRELNALQLSNKGMSLNELGRSAEALVCCERALEVFPRLDGAWTNKGNSLARMGRPNEALACYDYAIEINPRDEKAWNNKGAALNGLGRLEEALSCYERALEVNPRYETAWNSKAAALQGLGRPEEALACYERALEINSQDEYPWYNRGLVLAGLGLLEGALSCYERVLEINLRYESAWDSKGNALQGLGRAEEALACYERALEINPRKASIWHNKACALSGLDRPEEALECYDHALEINPLLVEAWSNRGCTLSTLGRLGEELDCYDRALKINPRFPEAWQNKGLALSALGRQHEALACFEEAKRLGHPQAT